VKCFTAFTNILDFFYVDQQQLVARMADPSGNGKMVTPPHPSNERMKQHDEVLWFEPLYVPLSF
jgi:hypothetical protein